MSGAGDAVSGKFVAVCECVVVTDDPVDVDIPRCNAEPLVEVVLVLVENVVLDAF